MSVRASVPFAHPDRALPADPAVRRIAREILEHTQQLPIVSMHGHVEASMLADDEAFPDPAALLVAPDHYLLRMLISQSVPVERLRPRVEGGGETSAAQGLDLWRLLCENWHLFRGTPTRYWLEHVLAEVFELQAPLSPDTAETSFDHISDRLASPEYRPRALFERFRIETLATTDAPQASLSAHAQLRREGWGDRVVPTFRPDALLEPLRADWGEQVAALGESAGIEVVDYATYLSALRTRRHAFIDAGARATDHSHLSAASQPLPDDEAAALFACAHTGTLSALDSARFTAHMLFQMAAMSADDGLVMQIHHGVLRNHDRDLDAEFGGDLGFDIPVGVEFSQALRPMLERFGRHPGFRLIAFTIDESTYSRELAPLAGVYPALRLGAPWWFLDAPEAMRRFRAATIETAGIYNTSGFVDDTRAFCSIPARHDLSRRIDAGFLAGLVAEHRLTLDEAIQTAADLAYHLPRSSYPAPQRTGTSTAA